MGNGITEMVFILDKSGSMSGFESDTIGGFNSMIEKQKAQDGQAFVTTVLFSCKPKILHDRVELKNVKPLTNADYTVGGATALLDAIGSTINHIYDLHKQMPKDEVPERTIFVITTDGYENASNKYTKLHVKDLIKLHEDAFNCEFLFLGANIDAVEVGASIGIKKERSVNFDLSRPKVLNCMFDQLDSTIDFYRKGGKIDENWAEGLESKLSSKKPPKNCK